VLSVQLGAYHLFPFRVFLLLSWLLFAIYVIVNNGRIKISHIRVKPQMWFLLIWLIYGILSLAWAADKGEVLKEVLYLFSGISIIFFIVYFFSQKKDLRNYYYLWIIVLAIFTMIGYWENITGNHFMISRNVLGLHPINKWRPTAVFHNENDFASFLGIVLPFILAWLHYKKGIIKKIVGFALFGSGIFLLLETGSRINILVIILELFVLFMFLIKGRKKIKVLILTGFIALVGLLVFPEISNNSMNTLSKQMGSIRLENDSISARISLSKNAVYYTIQSYGFGVGAGNIERYIEDYTPYPLRHELTNVHNWWIEILANYGVFIFIGYIFLYFNILRNLWRIWHRVIEKWDKIICESLLLSMIGFAIVSISSSSLMTFNPQWLLFGFALAFMNYYRIKYLDKDNK